MIQDYTNKFYSDQLTAFEPFEPVAAKGGRGAPPPEPEDIMVPVEYLENGDVIVRMFAKGAKEVRVHNFQISVQKFDLPLTNRGNGIFEGVIPASLGVSGNVPLMFTVDGSEVINRHLPVQYYAWNIANYIEIYDPETPYLVLRDVPHGTVSREIFWSETVGQFIRCTVYTPPGYEKSTEDYPVLFVQHGGGENETCWIHNGRVPYIMDNNIADGKTVPFIVVMNNGMLKVPGQTGMNDFDGIEGIITRDCRAFIESKYRVRRDKWGRAIAGLSLGSMQAVYIGLRNPDIFGAIGSFTYLRCRDKDNTYEGNPHLDAFKNPEKFWQDYKLLFRSLGGAEYHMNEFTEDDAFLAQCGVTPNEHYHRFIYPNQTHNWNCWRRAFNDFSQLVFRW